MKTLKQNTRLAEKLLKVKYVISDVDGVLSDGKIIIDNKGVESKHFDVKDGLGLILLQKAGVGVGIITGKSSDIVQRRFEALGIKDIYQGQKNKLNAFGELKQKYDLSDDEIACIGDDLPDLALLAKVGVAVAPKDASHLILPTVDYLCTKPGGYGAVREFVEILLAAKGLLDTLLSDYKIQGEAGF